MSCAIAEPFLNRTTVARSQQLGTPPRSQAYFMLRLLKGYVHVQPGWFASDFAAWPCLSPSHELIHVLQTCTVVWCCSRAGWPGRTHFVTICSVPVCLLFVYSCIKLFCKVSDALHSSRHLQCRAPWIKSRSPVCSCPQDDHSWSAYSEDQVAPFDGPFECLSRS